MKISKHERYSWTAKVNPKLKKLRHRNRCNRVRLFLAAGVELRRVANDNW